jgi:alpha-D-ribose 1-methylphosphonate 5-triphosphate synthase subunit PhnL
MIAAGMNAAAAPAIRIRGLAKAFTLHNQGGVTPPVLRRLSLRVDAGESVVLTDPSGSGKSTLLRAIYGNYKPQAGEILVRHGDRMVDLVSSEPRQILDVRRRTMGYVSQLLRVIPRVPALWVVAEPLRALGVAKSEALDRARALLARLRIPERLWELSPVTFSGGEQQRVNVARGFIAGHPILLLDEPTASLDAASRSIVVQLVREALENGAALLGTFHDADVRDLVSTRTVSLAEADEEAA